MSLYGSGLIGYYFIEHIVNLITGKEPFSSAKYSITANFVGLTTLLIPPITYIRALYWITDDVLISMIKELSQHEKLVSAIKTQLNRTLLFYFFNALLLLTLALVEDTYRCQQDNLLIPTQIMFARCFGIEFPTLIIVFVFPFFVITLIFSYIRFVAELVVIKLELYKSYLLESSNNNEFNQMMKNFVLIFKSDKGLYNLLKLLDTFLSPIMLVTGFLLIGSGLFYLVSSYWTVEYELLRVATQIAWLSSPWWLCMFSFAKVTSSCKMLVIHISNLHDNTELSQNDHLAITIFSQYFEQQQVGFYLFGFQTGTMVNYALLRIYGQLFFVYIVTNALTKIMK